MSPISDEEHHFESKADAGASKTYPQQAGTIRKNGYIVMTGPAQGQAKQAHGLGQPPLPRATSQPTNPRPSTPFLLPAAATLGKFKIPDSYSASYFYSNNPTILLQLDTTVVDVKASKTGKHGHAKCHFVGIDIFTAKKLEDIVPSSHNCDVPHVNRTDYQLIDISEDGFVSLLTENGNTKDDLQLPTDEALLTQIKDGFAEGKDLVVSVMSAMGEEQINALKDVGPK